MLKSLQVESDVWAAYYMNCSLLHAKRKNFAEFYKSSLLYLCYCPLDTLDDKTKLVGHQGCYGLARLQGATSKACCPGRVC